MNNAAIHRLSQHRTAVELSQDAIIGTDGSGVITEWNHGAEQLYGYAADEMIGKPVSILMPTERSSDFQENMQQLQQGERVTQFETVRKKKGWWTDRGRSNTLSHSRYDG